jgi:hypothetical protein
VGSHQSFEVDETHLSLGGDDDEVDNGLKGAQHIP